MVIKKKEGVLGEGEIKPFTKEEMEAWKWPIRIFLILAISMFIGWSVYTTPGLMNSIFAKTSTDVSGTGPSGGAGNPPIIGAATPTKDGLAKKDPGCDIWNEAVTVCLKRKTTPTPTLTQGQEKTGTVIISSKLLSRWGPLMSVDNIPAEIKLPKYGNYDKWYITDLKFGNDKISGYFKNIGTIATYPPPLLDISFVAEDGHEVTTGEFGLFVKNNEVAAMSKIYFETAEYSPWNKKTAEQIKQRAKYFKFNAR